MTQLILHYSISALAISQLLFMGMSYLIHYQQQPLGRLMAVYSACLMSYIFLVMPVMQSAPILVQQIFRSLAIVAPFCLWLISRHLFTDRSNVPQWAWVILLSYLSLRLTGHALIAAGRELDALSFAVLMYVPQTIMLFFAAHAIYLALRHFGSDLVEPRRRLRVPFILAMGLIVAVIVASGYLYFLPNPVRIIYFTVIFVCVLYFNIVTFRLHKDSPQVVMNSESYKADNIKLLETRSDKALLQRLYEAMETDQLYAKTGLTITDLASALHMQEYMLRRFINKKLNYRNFNQFLNEYRIKKATERLLQPGEPGFQISSIALDVGYASLSSFNKSFKELHGVTPSVFRNQYLPVNSSGGLNLSQSL
ncbi:MAG: helix-turn-helix transcriptional regulator [Pseudomonadales bacterium]|nr:helix-turn-helix transcriptional regulator [Pseudomonadales bacterium]